MTICRICSQPTKRGAAYCSRDCLEKGELPTEDDESEEEDERIHKPTPAEIAAATAAIRAEWSYEDYYKRAGLQVPTVEVV